MDRRIRTLLADDEPLAREMVRIRLENEPDLELVGEAADGAEAVDLILGLRPDLVFLDVQMPGMDGFEVVEEVADTHLPVIVFVTAHDQYALRAFDVHAVDYLLKPITAERLQEALRRARGEIAEQDAGEMRHRLLSLLNEHAARVRGSEPPEEPYATRFVVKDRDRFVFLRSAEIDWVEAAANYVRLHADDRSYLMRATMTDLEQKLDPEHFARIHRSTIVNIDRIAEIRPDAHGDFDVVLKKGMHLRLSRSFRDRLLP